MDNKKFLSFNGLREILSDFNGDGIICGNGRLTVHKNSVYLCHSDSIEKGPGREYESKSAQMCFYPDHVNTYFRHTKGIETEQGRFQESDVIGFGTKYKVEKLRGVTIKDGKAIVYVSQELLKSLDPRIKETFSLESISESEMPA